MIGTNSVATSVPTREVEGISRTERPVRFQAGAEPIFGILTEPLSTPRGVGVVLLNAASDRNRFLARLARRLAALGYHVLRFDYRGFGESSGPFTDTTLKHAMLTLTTLEEPFTEDLLGAVEELQRRGIERIVLIGRCFGARTALSGVRHIKGLSGIALLSLPLHQGGEGQQATQRRALDEVREAARRGIWVRALRGLFSARRRERLMRKLSYAARQLFRSGGAGGGRDGTSPEWVSKAVIDSLNEIVARRVPVLFVYGRLMSVYKDFCELQAGPLKDLFAQAGDRVTIAPVDGQTNNLTSLPVQEAVMERTIEWLESRVCPSAPGRNP